MGGWDLSPASGPKHPKVVNTLLLPGKRLKGDSPRVPTGWDQVARVNGIRGGFAPVGVAKPGVPQQGTYIIHSSTNGVFH